MRVQILTLAHGQSIPWHYHSEITDYFVCLEGTLIVETKAPRVIFIESWRPLFGTADERALCSWARHECGKIHDPAGCRSLR